MNPMWSFWKNSTAKVARAAVAAGILLCLLSIQPAAAIENLRVVRGVLILEGRIEAGDYTTVRNFLGDASNFQKMNGQIFLASQGGNGFEALQIGYLIRRLRLSTDAPSRPPPNSHSSGNEIIHPADLTNPRNYQCTSACFLLYVAGIYREFIWAGRLGVHNPHLEYKPTGVTEKEIAVAVVDMRNRIKNYLEEMNVPNKYLDLIYSVPPNDMRWITQSEFDADLKGYIPEIRALLDSKCNMNLPAQDLREMQKCLVQTKTELRNDAWRKIFRVTN